MARLALVWFVCVALALLGISGLHGHVTPGNSVHHHGAAGDYSHSLQILGLFDAGHPDAHDHEDAIDTDLTAQALTKLPALKVVALVVILFVVLPLRITLRAIRIRVTPPPRPPKLRPRSHLLPPAQAPPCAA